VQDREVTVYRLVSKATYEQQLFECASRKYGLDEAILGFGGGEAAYQQHVTATILG
jgi:chromodomain-helicase-DNA-binding protein 7